MTLPWSVCKALPVRCIPRRNGGLSFTAGGFRAVLVRNGILRRICGNGGISAGIRTTRSPMTGNIGKSPALGLYEFGGSTDINIAFDPENMGQGIPFHVVRDESDPDPRRRYKGLFNANGRRLAVSPDGFDWILHDAPPIPSQDESQFTHDLQSNRFLAMVKLSSEWGRSVWLSTSSDFNTFTEPQLIFHTDEIDRENGRRRVRKIIEDPANITPPLVDDEDYIAECYNMAVLPYEGLYIGFPTIFNSVGAIPPPETNHTRINQIELTVLTRPLSLGTRR